MSGATTELSLATAVDSDDNADYLTLSLANSLRTVDALFNNVTGHSHGGAHQGGPISSIPASAIPAGFITSAMIADGTITSADIADGTIQSVDLASGAVTQRRFAGGVAVSPATSSTTFANVPDLTVSLTTLGTTDLMVWAAMAIYNSALASFSQLAVSLDGAAEVGNMIASPTVTGGNGLLVLSTVWAFTTVSAAAHTVNARWSVGSGTMTNNGTERYLMVMEMRR